MFFVLSKVLIFLLKPFLWMVVCFLWAGFTRVAKRRRRLFIAGLVLLLIFSNPFLLREAFNLWEVPATGMDEIEGPYDVAIVLGGFSDPNRQPRDRLQIGSDGGRLLNAVELYQEGKVERLMISGGSATIVGEKIGEAIPTGRFLRRLGIPEEDIITDNGSRNTRENALASARLLKEMGSGDGELRCLLVTSGFHMRRARGCFERAGVAVTPFTTDHRGGSARGWTPGEFMVPSAGAMAEWERLIKEWVGMLVYKMRGWV
jgi:uncharacterized SAM-binding protein YcdF (DUF218 family)